MKILLSVVGSIGLLAVGYWLLGVFGCILAAIIILFILSTRKEKEPIPMEDKDIPIKEIRYAPDPNLSPEEDFIAYMVLCADQRFGNSLSPLQQEAVERYLLSDFESIKLSYIFESENALMLNDVGEAIRTAAKRYVESQARIA